ncbi:MAG: L-threonylcarbamoyladenylate synthase [bacterium]
MLKIKENEIEIAVSCLKNGGIIAFPTDTVYGIGVDGRNKGAYYKIYKIKKREEDKPIPFLIGDISYLEMMTGNVSKEAFKMAERFWPGPLTIILYSSPEFLWVSPKIALRVPNHSIPLLLLKSLKGPIAATSANISKEKEAIKVDEVCSCLSSCIDVIIDGGNANLGIASTIIDMTEKPKILRRGAIYQEVLRWIEKQ